MNAIPSQFRKPATKDKHSPGVIRTWGKLLADGRILELVRSPGTSRPALLLWDGRKATSGRSIRIDSRSYIVPRMESGLRRGLRLPPGCRPLSSKPTICSPQSRMRSRYMAAEKRRCATRQLLCNGIACHRISERRALPIAHRVRNNGSRKGFAGPRRALSSLAAGCWSDCRGTQRVTQGAAANDSSPCTRTGCSGRESDSRFKPAWFRCPEKRRAGRSVLRESDLYRPGTLKESVHGLLHSNSD